MKKIYVPLFVLSLLIGTGNAHAQQPSRKGADKIKKTSSRDKSIRLRTTSVTKLPQKAQLFSWDNTEEVWIENGHTEYTYDTKGNILTELKITTQGDSSELSLKSYNSRGQQTEHVSKRYDSFTGAWINSFKETISYDAQGNQAENISYYWENNQWQISWSYQTQRTYDAQNRLTEEIELEYDSNEEAWVNEGKMTYGYSGNEQAPNILTEYEYDEDTWIKTAEYTNIVWRDFGGIINEDLDFVSLDYTEYDEGMTTTGRMSTTINGNTMVYLQEIYIEDTWTGSYRSTSVVLTDGSTVTTRERFEDGNWIYTDRDTEYTDSKGEPAGYKYEEYNSGEWIVHYSNQRTNTYNDNDEKVETVMEYVSGNYIAKEKQVFSDFITIDRITGLSSSTVFASLSLFPNPATDVILLENIPAGAELSIATIGNQQVLNTILTESSARISVADLRPGIYFTTIRSASGEVKTLKFIKQ